MKNRDPFWPCAMFVVMAVTFVFAYVEGYKDGRKAGHAEGYARAVDELEDAIKHDFIVTKTRTAPQPAQVLPARPAPLPYPL